MSPRTFVIRGAALFVLGLGIAACETKTIVQQPPADVVVTVSPSTANLTKAGATVQYVALVTGVGANGNTAVTWKSSNTAVATVAASGNTATVTAVANGTASIIATSVQDASRSGAATVTVQITDTTKTVAPPSVSIQSITTNAGTPADNNNIQGLINVTLNVDVPTGNAISSVNWLIDGKTVCSQTFSQGKSAGDVTTQAADAVTMTCQINTASLTNGTPTFANGSHTLSATLVGPSGTTQASTSQALVFNNQNQLSATVATTKNAIGATGLVWNGGNLTVTATPVIFSGSAVARTTFTFSTVGGTSLGQVVDSTAADGFTATFRGDTAGGPLTGISDSVVVTLSTVTVAGTQGPSQTTSQLRFDNLAPASVQFFFNKPFAWINGSFKFKSAIDTTKDMTGAARAGAVDVGVDRVTYTFFAADTSRAVLTSAITSGADLADSNNNTTYAIKVVLADALGNSRTEWGSVVAVNDTTSPNCHFGVDKQAPIVVFDVSNAVADTAKFTTNPTTANYVVGFQDLGASGFATATPLQVIEKADTGSGSVCVVGTSSSGSLCDQPVSFNSQVPVDGTAGTQQGYVTMTAFVVDRAGNQSNVLTRKVLVDYTAPVADSATVTTAPLAGGAAETFRAFLHDNVSLASAGGNISYAAALGAIPFVKTLPSVTYGGFGTFTKTATADFADPFFIRAIETTVGGAWILPTALNVSPKDVAGNAPAATPFASVFTGLAAPTSDPFAGATVTAAGDSSSASLTATLTITGTAATVSPAAQVLFYQFNTATGAATLVGTGSNPVITVNGTQATFTYTAAPTATLKPGTQGLAALFVTSGGVALAQIATFTP